MAHALETFAVIPIKWPVDWNRPLSTEERAIAKRLANVPDKDTPEQLRMEDDVRAIQRSHEFMEGDA